MNSTIAQTASDKPLDSPGFMVYCILMAVIILVAGVVMGITVLALVMARSIPRILRFFLINLLLAGLFMGLGVIFIVSTSAILVLVGSEHPRPPQYLCRVYMWMYAVGAVARLWNLAAFSLSVLAIVRFGKKTISLCFAAVIVIILWIVPIAVSLYVLLPYVFEAQFVQGVACFPDDNNTQYIQARHTFFANWATAGGLIPISVSVAVPIICLYYIKKNIFTEDAQYCKGMAKFSLFLVIGGAINIAGQLLPGAIAYYAEAPGLYCAYGIAAVSLLPTPIIIIAYLKPVQEQFKKMFTCDKLTKKGKGLSLTTSTNIPNETDRRV